MMRRCGDIRYENSPTQREAGQDNMTIERAIAQRINAGARGACRPQTRAAFGTGPGHQMLRQMP